MTTASSFRTKDSEPEASGALDAGWDDLEPVVSDTGDSQTDPLTITASQSEEDPAEALDDGWDLDAEEPSAAPEVVEGRGRVDHSGVQRTIPRAISKRELREAQRRQRAHAAKRRAERKELRRAQRKTETERVVEPQRSNQQQKAPPRAVPRKTPGPERGARGVDKLALDQASPTRKVSKGNADARGAVAAKSIGTQVVTPKPSSTALPLRILVGILVALALGGAVLIAMGRH